MIRRRSIAALLALFGSHLPAILLAAPLPANPSLPPAAGVSLTTSEPATGSAEKDGRLLVQVFAMQQTVLSAEVAAKVSRLTLKEGDRFTAGQVLVSFDCAMFQSQLSKADAQLEAANQSLRVNKRLAELNSISNLEVDQAQAKVKETQAEAALMRTVVSKCTLVAPFTGRVAKVYAEPHQYLTQGKPILDIVDTNNLEIRMIIPSKWLSWLGKGAKFHVFMEDLGRDYTARVTRIGARIDPVSRSVSMAAEFEGKPLELLPGMSGWAKFTLPK